LSEEVGRTSPTSLKMRSFGRFRSTDFGCVLAVTFVMMSAGLARFRSCRASRSMPCRAWVATTVCFSARLR